MEQVSYSDLAQRVRDLADRADRLLKLAESYDVKGGRAGGGPRLAERPLPVPRTSPPTSIFSGPGEA